MKNIKIEELKAEAIKILNSLKEESLDELINHDNAIDAIDFYDVEKRTIMETTNENVELKLKALLSNTNINNEKSALKDICNYKISGKSLKDKNGKKITNKYKMATIQFDYDTSLRNILIYALAFDYVIKKDSYINMYKFNFFEIVQKDNQKYKFRGDTMNSYSTTMHRYLSKIKNFDISKYNDFGDARWEAAILDNYDFFVQKISKSALKFIELNHKLGNFIPMMFINDCSLNVGRYSATKDYWDLTLLCIYKWYRTNDDNFLLKLFTNGEVARNAKLWLSDNFKSWEDFVVKNYMKAFIDLNNDWKPKELWKGHFSGALLPRFLSFRKELEFEQFFTNVSNWEFQRSKEIAKAIKEKVRNMDINKFVNKLFERR